MRQFFPTFYSIHCVLQGPWPTSFRQFSCLHLRSCCRNPGITDVSTTSGLLHGFWDPNSDHQAYPRSKHFSLLSHLQVKTTNKQTTKNIYPAPYIFMNYKSKVSIFFFLFLFPDPSQNPKPALPDTVDISFFWGRPLSCTCSTSNGAACDLSCWTFLLSGTLTHRRWLSLPL